MMTKEDAAAGPHVDDRNQNHAEISGVDKQQEAQRYQQENQHNGREHQV